jgi:hypothetical protein
MPKGDKLSPFGRLESYFFVRVTANCSLKVERFKRDTRNTVFLLISSGHLHSYLSKK